MYFSIFRIGEIKYIVKRSEYVYGNNNKLLKLAEKLKNEAGTELLQKTTSFRYDSNGNEIRRSVEYIALYSKTNPKAYEAAVYNEDTTEPIHAVVEQTISQYDGFNRLKKTEIIKGGVKTAVEYVYNGDGLRVEKTVRRSDKDNTAETTSYLYDRQHVILETRGSKSIRYARGINYIARIDNTDKLSYFMYNGHGDVVQTVSEDGVIENQYDYDIFGNPTLTVESYNCSIRYAGEFYDAETGLYYLRARYYDPYIGRFISEDSYWGEDSNPLSLNLYTYTHNDPIQFIDPSGHSAYDKGQQQVKEQVKNESQQSLKNKLNAQKSSYDSAVSSGNSKEAEIYKGRMDALSSMMSSSGSSSSGSGRSSGGSSSSSGSGSSSSRDSSKVTVSWEGYIIDIDISEYNEYKSHGWGIFYGEAYSDKMYNYSDMLDSMITSSGQKVTIENRGYIGRIETGEGSHTTINNRGDIGTIITGVGSTTTININNTGKVTSIKTGDSHSGRRDSRTTINNYGIIDYIETGKGSENKVIKHKQGKITSLVTGEGNRTAIYADEFEFVKAELQKGSYEKIDISAMETGETDFWSQQGYFDNFWWQDEDKINKAIAELEYLINTTGSIDLSKVRDPNIMVAIQRISGSLTTKVYGTNTYETIQVIQAKYKIEGNAMILDQETFDAMVDRYNKGLIGQEFGDFAERTEFAYVVDVAAYAAVGYASMVPKVKGTSNAAEGAGKVENPLSNIRYTDKVKSQMTKGDYHGFPSSVDAFGKDGIVTKITGGDSIVRTKVEIPGNYQGKQGVFQYIIEPDGVTVNHRLFVPK